MTYRRVEVGLLVLPLTAFFFLLQQKMVQQSSHSQVSVIVKKNSTCEDKHHTNRTGGRVSLPPSPARIA